MDSNKMKIYYLFAWFAQCQNWVLQDIFASKDMNFIAGGDNSIRYPEQLSAKKRYRIQESIDD